MTQPTQSTLEQLNGCWVVGVTFAGDYVRLRIGSLILTCLVWPRVTTSEATFDFGMPGYRDALCGQIEKLVESVTVDEENMFRMLFTDGSIVEVSLRVKDRPGPETLVLSDLKGERLI
jgi:hypothetical protein